MDKYCIYISISILVIIIALSGLGVCIGLLVKEMKIEKKDPKNLEKSVTGGTIKGYSAKTKDVIIFKNVPFAAPPIKDLRWRRPQDVIPWDGILDCTIQGPNPIQGANEIKPGEYGSEILPDPNAGYSEDCLKLNIWTNSKGQKMPVVVFIYGGAWSGGGNSVEIYNGEYLASQKVVFVCPNYRLGLFGFLGSDVLSEEDPEGSTGNYGLMDIIKSLEWVQQNIQKFGGDPENVILLGGSAGGNLIDMLMISLKAKGLFNRAISMSYPIDPVGEAWNFTTKKNAGNSLMKNKDDLFKLRNMSYEEIIKKPESLLVMVNAGPCVDNVYINDVWRDEVGRGKTNDIDYIAGFNYNENYPNTGDSSFAMMIGIPEGADAGDVLKTVYNIAAIYRNKAGSKSTYIVQFTHEKPGPKKDGAIHDGHVPYFLNYFSPSLNNYWTDSDFKMGKVASQYLINFCRFGNPNGHELPKWEKSFGNYDYFEMGDKCGMKVFDEKKYQLVFEFLKSKYQFDFLNHSSL